MKITKYIPNTITSMNLLCGFLGVIAAFGGHIQMAFLFMIGGAVFDFCDGLSARALDAYSPMGKELDSLSDMVTFGVLPASLLYLTMKALCPDCGILVYVPAVIAVLSGLRLAKFNIDERQSHSFIGLPTPACAMICGSLAFFVAASTDANFVVRLCSTVWFIPVLSIVLALLLVSEVPMFSMKFSKEDGRPLKVLRAGFFGASLAVVAVVLILGINWSIIPCIVFLLYILLNVVLLFAAKK